MGFGIEAYISIRDSIKPIKGTVKPVSKSQHSTAKDNYQDQLREQEDFKKKYIKQLEALEKQAGANQRRR